MGRVAFDAQEGWVRSSLGTELFFFWNWPAKKSSTESATAIESLQNREAAIVKNL